MVKQYTRGDVPEPVRATLTNRDGTPVDLTSCVVQHRMRLDGATANKVDAPAAVVGDPKAGTVEYVWLAGDLDTVGWGRREWEVVRPGSKPKTYPATTVRIVEGLRP